MPLDIVPYAPTSSYTEALIQVVFRRSTTARTDFHHSTQAAREAPD